MTEQKHQPSTFVCYTIRKAQTIQWKTVLSVAIMSYIHSILQREFIIILVMYAPHPQDLRCLPYAYSQALPQVPQSRADATSY